MHGQVPAKLGIVDGQLDQSPLAAVIVQVAADATGFGDQSLGPPYIDVLADLLHQGLALLGKGVGQLGAIGAGFQGGCGNPVHESDEFRVAGGEVSFDVDLNQGGPLAVRYHL